MKEKRRYRTVEVAMWSDGKFMSLSRDAQFLWLYLLTGPETTQIPGLVMAGEGALSDAMQWSRERFRERFGELSALGMAKGYFEHRFVWLPNGLKRNPPANPNIVKSWRDQWDLVPECPAKSEIYQCIKRSAERFPKPFRELFGEPPRNGMANQEQEQEQEQEDLFLSQVVADRDDEGSSGSSPEKPPRELDPRAYQLADFLRDQWLKAKPDHRIGKRKWDDGDAKRRKWAEEFDRMHRIDGRDWRRSGELVKWVFAGCPGFKGQYVVESAKALREKWDSIDSQFGGTRRVSSGSIGGRLLMPMPGMEAQD